MTKEEAYNKYLEIQKDRLEENKKIRQQLTKIKKITKNI